MDRVADLLGLARFLDRQAETLSGGELRRTQIARAIAGRPALLILDEPTTGLDPDAVHRVFDYLRAEADGGASVVISTHETSRFASVCDRVVALQDWRLIGNLGRVEFMSHGPVGSDDLWTAYRALASGRLR